MSRNSRTTIAIAAVLAAAVTGLFLTLSRRLQTTVSSDQPISNQPAYPIETLHRTALETDTVPGVTPVKPDQDLDRANLDDSLGRAASRTSVELWGMVLGPNGSPIEGRRSLYLSTEQADYWWTLVQGGKYSAGNLPAGSVRLLFDASGFKPIVRSITLRADEIVHREDLALEPAWSLKVNLESSDGRGLYWKICEMTGKSPNTENGMEMAIVASVDPPDQPTTAVHVMQNTWLEGNLVGTSSIDIVDDPPIYVSVLIGDHVLATQRLDARVEEVTLTVDVETIRSVLSGLEFQALDQYTALPIEGLTASLVNSFKLRSRVISDAEGHVKFPPQAPGMYRLEIEWKDRFVTSRTVHLVPGQTTNLGAISIGSGVEISGRFSDAESQPEQEWDAWIQADDTDGETFGTRCKLHVGVDGRFSTWGFASGRYVLWAESYKRREGQRLVGLLGVSGPVSVDTRKAPVKDLVVEMRPPVRLHFRPTIASFEGYEFTIRSSERGTAWWYPTRLLDGFGGTRYVAPGSYVLTVTRLGELVSRIPFQAHKDVVVLDVP